MSNLILNILGYIPPVGKAIFAVFALFGIYVKDLTYLHSILATTGSLLGWLDETIYNIQFLSFFIPPLIIGIEIYGLYLKNNKEVNKWYRFIINCIPLLIIFLLTFSRYLLPVMEKDAGLDVLVITFLKCSILVGLVIAFHEFFLHAYKESERHYYLKNKRLRLYILIRTNLINIQYRIVYAVAICLQLGLNLTSNINSCFQKIKSFKRSILFSINLSIGTLNTIIDTSFVTTEQLATYCVAMNNKRNTKYAVYVLITGLFLIL